MAPWPYSRPQFLQRRSNRLDASEVLAMLKSSCGDDEAMKALTGEGDVAFVLEHCDADGDKQLAREEVLPMLAMWRELVHEIKERHASSSDLLGAAAESPPPPPKSPMPPPKSSKKGSSTCILL